MAAKTLSKSPYFLSLKRIMHLESKDLAYESNESLKSSLLLENDSAIQERRIL